MKLEDGERVIDAVQRWTTATLPQYAFTLGFFHFWRQRGWLILTDRRVILRLGVFNVVVRTLPLTKVQDATVRVTWLSEGTIVITSAGGPAGSVGLGPIEGDHARAFVDAVNAQLGSARETASPTTPKQTPQDRLSELQGLFDSGAIDQSEFAELRSKILASI